MDYSPDYIDINYSPPTWMLSKEYILPHPEHIKYIKFNFDNIMYKSKCSYMWYNSDRNVIEIWAEVELSLYLAWHLIDIEVKKFPKFEVVKRIISWADDVENASDEDFCISID